MQYNRKTVRVVTDYQHQWNDTPADNPAIVFIESLDTQARDCPRDGVKARDRRTARLGDTSPNPLAPFLCFMGHGLAKPMRVTLRRHSLALVMQRVRKLTMLPS